MRFVLAKSLPAFWGVLSPDCHNAACFKFAFHETYRVSMGLTDLVGARRDRYFDRPFLRKRAQAIHNL
jgi:hypothetical protein